MSRLWTLSIVIGVLAIPSAADNASRIRVENSSQPGSRVAITFADPARTPAQLEAGEDGSVELVVEAPSRRLRLRGGSLRTDPMIAALARRKLLESSAGPSLHVMNSIEPPAQFSSSGGPLVYDDLGGFWGGASWGAGWSGGYCDPFAPGRLRDIPVAREIPRDHRTSRPSPPAQPRGSYSARAVMPRVGGRR